MIKVVSGYSISSQNSASPSAAEGAKRLANMTNPNHTEYCETRGYELLHFDENYNWDINGNVVGKRYFYLMSCLTIVNMKIPNGFSGLILMLSL